MIDAIISNIPQTLRRDEAPALATFSLLPVLAKVHIKKIYLSRST
jgi:monomeric isocitrate dehydrogenase